MQIHKGRALAVGILCAVAATVTLWSGALSSASGALHSSGPAQAVHVTSHSGR